MPQGKIPAFLFEAQTHEGQVRCVCMISFLLFSFALPP